MDAPRWLTSDERETWLRLTAVLELLPAALDAQLHGDADLTQFEYMVLAMLSEADERRLRMSSLAARTTATLPRLSRVVAGLEQAGYVVRTPCEQDRRAINATLTDAGFDKLVAAAPGHVAAVRRLVIDPLTPAQLADLGSALGAMLERLDPDGRMLASVRQVDAGHARGAEPGAAGRADATGSSARTAPEHPLPRLAAPAARALDEAGYESLDALAGVATTDLMRLHGVGRSALRAIRESLAAAELSPLGE
ncbi:MAG: MarR family winged helix-turn-helix transcriptional regulator [Pseudoclavibacter sp.]